MRDEALTPPNGRNRRLSGGRKGAGGTVEEYTGLPYHLMVVRDGEDKSKPWTAYVEELPGFTSHGKTSDEAWVAIQSAMAKWISVALEEGREIPEPRSATSHSGRLLLRMPRTLHADLTRASERGGGEPEPVHHRRPRRRRRVASRAGGFPRRVPRRLRSTRRPAPRGSLRSAERGRRRSATRRGHERGPGGELRHRRRWPGSLRSSS